MFKNLDKTLHLIGQKADNEIRYMHAVQRKIII